MKRALRWLTAGCALALVTGTGATAAPAYAATGSPPVTQNDSARMYAGNAAVVDVLANDSDPDGDDLAICRVGESTYKYLDLVDDGDQLVMISHQRAAPGDYTFTYYACDFSYLTPATLTLTILPEPNITVTKLAGKPGKLKVRNPADFRIRFLYGSFQEDTPDGQLGIKRHSSVVITVHRHKIVWIAYTRRGDFLKLGRVKNIQLPPGDQPPAAGRYSANASGGGQAHTRWRSP